MPIPPGFPLYPDGKYHVSLTFPGPPPLDQLSDISKSIEGTSPSLLLVPNVEFLQKFVEGDIGIGDSILKGAFIKNFNSPITKGNEFVFKKLAELTKIDIGNVDKYKALPPELSNLTSGSSGTGAAGAVSATTNAASGAASAVTGAVSGASNGINLDSIPKSKLNFKLPLDQIKVSSEFSLGGVKGMEKTLLKSIFETQKPYMEIAKIAVSTISKAEDVVARIMPLALPIGTPLTTESEKPIGNSGQGPSRPKALGFGGGNEIKNALGKLDAITKKGGATKVNPDGSVDRQGKVGASQSGASQSSGQSNFSNGGENLPTVPPEGYTYSIVSSVYSTGNFDPSLEYQYTYVDIPADEQVGNNDQNLNLNDDGDPYKGFKPDCIIFGIYDSLGAPFAPLTALEGYNNSGNKVGTNFKKAEWIVDSPKWKFTYSKTNTGGNYIWPSYGTPNFYFDREIAKRVTIAKSAPSVGEGEPSYTLSTYEKDQKNILNGEDAIPGDPVIASFDSPEVTEYESFFKDLIEFKLATTEGITDADKNEARAAVYQQLNVQAHLENVFQYGQAKSSYYKPIEVPTLPDKDNPFPSSLRKSLKPFKIYSAKAAADTNLRKVFGTRMDDRNGNIWVDPEADYAVKVIRVDPTTQIQYTEPGKQEPIIATIKAFIKNATLIKISDDRTFNIVVQKSTNPSQGYFLFDSQTNATSYYLENWNYVDNDGILASGLTISNSIPNNNNQFGNTNQQPQAYGFGNAFPTLNNTNAYKITIWGDKNTPYYDTVGGYIAWKVTGGFVELEKQPNATWTYNKFDFDFNVNNDFAFAKLKAKLEVTSGVEIDTLYQLLKTNPTATYTFTTPVTLSTDKDSKGNISSSSLNPSGTASGTIIFEKQVVTANGTVAIGNLENIFRYANTFTLKAGTEVNGSYPEYTFTIQGNGAVYNSNTGKTTISIQKRTGITIDSSYYITQINYNVPISILFSRKINIPVTGIIRLEEDDSIIEVQNGKITKWFYMTPKDLVLNNGQTGGYGNGDFNNSSTSITSQNSVFTTAQDVNISNGGYTVKILPNNGYRRTLSIKLGSNTSGLWSKGSTSNPKKPVQNIQDVSFNNFQIRVATPNNPNGAIIDPSQVFNDSLKTDKPFINTPGTKYGHGSTGLPQEIGVIKRFMLTEFDTESYYIVEGILPELADELSGATASGANQGSGGGGSGGGGYYKLPDAIGAIKVFISLLVDIFSKLIPNIKRLLSLLQDPRTFITEIAKEKLGEGFPFLSPEAFDTFKNAINIAKGAAAATSGGLTGVTNMVKDGASAAGNVTSSGSSGASSAVNNVTGAASAAGSVSDATNSIPKRSEIVKKLQNHFKSSKLNGVVFVGANSPAMFKSVLDGIGTIPFELFGKDLSFGMELNMSKLPENPLKLVFPQNITIAKLKSDVESLANKNADKENVNSMLSDNLTGPAKSVGEAGTQNQLPNGTQLNSNDYKILNVKYSTGEFINGVDYNFVYTSEEAANLIDKADELVRKGTADDLKKAEENLEAAKKIDPDNKLIDEKLKDVKKNKNFFELNTQPTLKFLLGFITLPIKIVTGIIQYLMDFFKSLTNPLKLPSALAEFLSFQWIMKFFIPPGPPLPGLLKLVGINFDPTLLTQWVTLSKIPNPAKLTDKLKQAKDLANKATSSLTSASNSIDPTKSATNVTGGGGSGATITGNTNSAAARTTNTTTQSTQQTLSNTASSSGGTKASDIANAAKNTANDLSTQLKSGDISNIEIPNNFPWPMPLPKGDFLIPDDFELADLNKFISVPFDMKLPTYTARQIRTSPKNPLYLIWPILCFIEKIVNSIIDFFWSILGIEAIIPPPHIKICKAINDETLNPEDLQKLLNGETPKGGKDGSGNSGSPGTGITASGDGAEAFIYEITLQDGRKIQSLNQEDLQKFLDENKDISYDFQF